MTDIADQIMSASATCPKCGQSVPADAPQGTCPNCLMGLLGAESSESGSALRETQPSACAPFLGRTFGDYELLEEIAHGGMGIVYRARQIKLNRIVAIKMILAGQFAGKQLIRRFRTEVTAAALLQHPNIVAIRDVGIYEGQHFFAMDFVDGQNLAQFVGNRPLAATKAARYVKLIAEAIHYAHEQGILHRDLKPSNVLIDANDQPRVTDFGLARRLDGESTLTVTGQVLGSPNFMPPEQASSQRGKVGRQSDVYGLGAILYHLLTARPPFQADSLEGIVTQVLDAEAVAPRLLNPGIPLDLETICLRCLEKEPSRRYRTAQELAEELDRFLSDEPILARPVSRSERAWRWCRRKPALATLGGVALFLLFIVVVGAPIAVFRINQAKVKAERNLYSADMKFASEALRDGAIAHAEDLLRLHQPDKAPLRGLEWRYLWQALEQRKAKRTLIGLSHKGFSLAYLRQVNNTLYNVEETSDQIRAWDMRTWAPLPLIVPPQPASVRWWWRISEEAALAVDTTNRTLTVYQLPGFARGPVIPFPGRPTQAAISPDRRILAVSVQDAGTNGVMAWDLVRNLEIGQIGRYSSEVSQLVFSVDSRVLCVGCNTNGVIELWDVAALTALPSPPKIARGFGRVELIGDGSHLLFDSHEGDLLHVWDRREGISAPIEAGEVGGLTSFGVSPNGETLVTIWDDRVVLYDAKTLRKLLTQRSHLGYITAVRFSPDYSLLATGSYDHSAKLWDLKTGRELATLGGHADIVADVVFSADGKALVTLGGEGEIKVWGVSELVHGNVFVQNSRPSWRFGVSPDEHTLAALDIAGTLHVWDRFSGTETHSIQTGESDFPNVAFAPNGKSLAWIAKNCLGILDLKSGKHDTNSIQGNLGLAGIAFSPDSREIAFSSHTNVMLWDLETRRFHPFASFGEEIYTLRYSPDGALLAFGHEHGGVSLWERKTGKKLTEQPAVHVFLTSGLAFSADGRWLATAGSQTINLWPVTAEGLGRPRTFTAHVGYIPAVAFSPDATRLVSASSDHTLKFWSTSDSTEVGTLYGHDACVSDVFFCQDGNTIFSNGLDGTIRIWEAAPLSHLGKKAETAVPVGATVRR